MKRFFITFLLFGVVIFVLMSFTAKTELSDGQRLGYTAVLALVPALLSLSGGKSAGKSGGHPEKNNPDCDLGIFLPRGTKVLYRISNKKIYKSMDHTPIYEIKGNRIYPYLSSKPIFRIDGNKIYEELKSVPVFEVKGNMVYHNLSSKVAYEIKYLR